MNREIKFRAWHKKYKKMYEVLHLHLDGDEGIWATVKGYSCIENKDIHIQIQPKDIEIMQYTGLHDKNGKEIYEDDIFKDYLGNIYIASWYITKWALREKTKTGIIMHDFHNIGEVIGDIYSNPELLEGT